MYHTTSVATELGLGHHSATESRDKGKLKSVGKFIVICLLSMTSIVVEALIGQSQ